ncbi:hypothetical protein ACLOJK_031681 [Asimina triloba]
MDGAELVWTQQDYGKPVKKGHSSASSLADSMAPPLPHIDLLGRRIVHPRILTCIDHPENLAATDNIRRAHHAAPSNLSLPEKSIAIFRFAGEPLIRFEGKKLISDGALASPQAGRKEKSIALFRFAGGPLIRLKEDRRNRFGPLIRFEGGSRSQTELLPAGRKGRSLSSLSHFVSGIVVCSNRFEMDIVSREARVFQ